MKTKYLLLFLIGLFIPSFVFAHEAYTKVNVDVFYKEKDAYYDTLMIALDELSNETDTQGKFELKTHPYTEALSKKAYKYSGIENSNDLLIFVGGRFNTGFSNKKYISENSDTISTLYNYYKGNLKEMILYEYKLEYDGIIVEIERGYWDSYLDDSTPSNETSDSDIDDYEELKNIFNDLKDNYNGDKLSKNILYPIIFLVLFSISTKTLKKSINKNK
jgi:hypothetical protein